ncbi:unnamed protein product [Arctogadus glacialis]
MQGLTGSSGQGSFIPEARGRRDLNGISKQSRFKGEVARPEGIVSLTSWPGFEGLWDGSSPMLRDVLQHRFMSAVELTEVRRSRVYLLLPSSPPPAEPRVRRTLDA